jgi:DNA-binding CsgD family transcriptional regulator
VTTDPYGGPNFVERSLPSSGASCPAGSCPACGTRLEAGADQSAFPLAVPQSIAAALLLTGTLSGREGTVFELLGMGYDNRSIAAHLGISERTVKRHITVILAKLHLESRLQAGLAALVTSADNSVFVVMPLAFPSQRGGGILLREWPESRIATDLAASDNERITQEEPWPLTPLKLSARREAPSTCSAPRRETC